MMQLETPVCLNFCGEQATLSRAQQLILDKPPLSRGPSPKCHRSVHL
jgi:hypothetical protein